MEAKKTAGGAEQGGVQFSQRANFAEDKYYSRQIENLENLRDGSYVTVGRIAENSPLNQVGIPAETLYFDVSKIRKEMKDRSDPIPTEKIKEVPNVLNNPIVITEYVNKQGIHSVNVYGKLYIGSSPVVVGVMISKTQKGNLINKIQTVHPNRHFANEMTADKILYLTPNKKEARQWFQSLSAQMPLLGETKSGFIRSIAQKESEVKFSKRAEIFAQLDSEYAKTVENNDTEAAQRLVDEAAKEAGYTVKAYHGTLTKGIHKFDKKYIGSRFSFDEVGFFFTDLKSIAEDYATSEFDSDKKGEVISAYLRMKKPFIFNKNFAIKNGYGNVFRDNDSIGVWDAYQGAILDEIYGKRFDGIIVDDGTSKMYVVFDPNQIKSSDAVTYDDEGNVIPLSERFNERNEDIRFSKRSKLDSFNAESYNEIKLGKQEYARLSAAIGTEQPNAKGIVTQILDNENGESALVYTAFVSDDKLRVLKKKEVKYAERKRKNYVDRKSRGSIGYSGESGYKRSDSSALLGNGRKPNERNDRVSGRVTRGRDGGNGRGNNQDVSDSGKGSREPLTAVSDLGKVQYQLRTEDKNRLDILDKQEERLANDLKTLEKAYGEAVRREYEKNIKPDEGTSERAARINEKAAMFWLALRRIQKGNYILFGLS